MSTLYVTEQGAIVRKRSDRLLVTKGGETLAEVPCLHLKHVALFGAVQVSTPALAELLDHGISFALFARRGRYRGRLVSPFGNDAELRLRQAEVARSPELSLVFSRAIVAAKLANAAGLMQRYRRNYPELVSREDLLGLDRSEGVLARASSLDEVRGIEGHGATVVFAAYARLVHPPFAFAGRERRPPPDPVNALLSLGYMLLLAELDALVAGTGLDPFVGFFHQVRHSRASLSLDLLEPFRAPVVDRAVIKACNLGVVHPDDFEGDAATGVRLRRDGLKRFLAMMERELGGGGDEAEKIGTRRTLRQCLRDDVEHLARWLRDGTRFEPYRSAC